MFKHRVARNRVLYFIVWLAILGSFGYLVTNYQLEFYQLFFVALIFLLPGRIVHYFWRDFFRGRRKLSRQKYDAAIESFYRFLLNVESSPSIKWLMFFSYGLYSFKVEAVTLNYLGVCYLHQKSLELAERSFQKSLEIDAKYVMAYKHLSALAIVRNEMEKAKQYYADARKHGFPNVKFETFEKTVRDDYGN